MCKGFCGELVEIVDFSEVDLEPLLEYDREVQLPG
jgi:hypothetical protein